MLQIPFGFFPFGIMVYSVVKFARVALLAEYLSQYRIGGLGVTRPPKYFPSSIMRDTRQQQDIAVLFEQQIESVFEQIKQTLFIAGGKPILDLVVIQNQNSASL
jgi:hypothetical protein